MRPRPEAELEGEVFENERFRGEDLAGLRTKNCTFNGCDFSNARLNGSEHVGSDFANSVFENANLFGAAFVDCRLLGASFPGAVLTGVRIERGDLSYALIRAHDLPARGYGAPTCATRPSTASTSRPRSSRARSSTSPARCNSPARSAQRWGEVDDARYVVGRSTTVPAVCPPQCCLVTIHESPGSSSYGAFSVTLTPRPPPFAMNVPHGA